MSKQAGVTVELGGKSATLYYSIRADKDAAVRFLREKGAKVTGSPCETVGQWDVYKLWVANLNEETRKFVQSLPQEALEEQASTLAHERIGK